MKLSLIVPFDSRHGALAAHRRITSDAGIKHHRQTRTGCVGANRACYPTSGLWVSRRACVCACGRQDHIGVRRISRRLCEWPISFPPQNCLKFNYGFPTSKTWSILPGERVSFEFLLAFAAGVNLVRPSAFCAGLVQETRGLRTPSPGGPMSSERASTDVDHAIAR